MIIVEINATNFGSTGNIMLQIAEKATDAGAKVYCSFPKSRQNARKSIQNSLIIGGRISRNIHNCLGIITGFQECFSFFGTLHFLRQIKKIKPDLIHLHNLHGSYINLPLLFRFIKRHNIPIVWTLHDCWSFTGHCPHFSLAKCDKWKKGCYKCPIYKEYPQTSFDNTRIMWKLKKKWFTGVKDLTVVAPSTWLAELATESYLNEYPIKVIHSGIDLSIFHPAESNFRVEHGIKKNQFIVLGVSFAWSNKKGIDVFIELSKRLDDRFQIVLVGVSDNIKLPNNIITINRTQNQKELASIYSAADLFVNPTREEVLGLVNIEALACGTPVITFNSGGSPECIDEKTGVVVDIDDIESIENEIIRIFNHRPFKSEDCVSRAMYFNKDDRYKDYVNLYLERSSI